MKRFENIDVHWHAKDRSTILCWMCLPHDRSCARNAALLVSRSLQGGPYGDASMDFGMLAVDHKPG